mmetsp:Transcript_44397/g.79612  ORF Transcript_44397/g.79612 Transcript_44397/m.79612 type:complete len:202 (-) Transcript_44397:1526-2131(-)
MNVMSQAHGCMPFFGADDNFSSAVKVERFARVMDTCNARFVEWFAYLNFVNTSVIPIFRPGLPPGPPLPLPPVEQVAFSTSSTCCFCNNLSLVTRYSVRLPLIPPGIEGRPQRSWKGTQPGGGWAGWAKHKTVPNKWTKWWTSGPSIATSGMAFNLQAQQLTENRGADLRSLARACQLLFSCFLFLILVSTGCGPSIHPFD